MAVECSVLQTEAVVCSCSVQVAAEIVLRNDLHVCALVTCRAMSHMGF